MTQQVQAAPTAVPEGQETTHLAMFNTLLDTMSRLEQRLHSMETKIEAPIQATPSSSIPTSTEQPDTIPLQHNDTDHPDMESYTFEPDPEPQPDNTYNSYTANNFHSVDSIAKHLPQLATEPAVEAQTDPTDPMLTQSISVEYEPIPSVPTEATRSVELPDTPPNSEACPVVVKEDKRAKAVDSPVIAKTHAYEDLRYPDTLSHMIKRILGNRLNEHHIASDDAQNILDLLAGRLQRNDDPIRSVPAYLLGLINKFKRNDLDLSPLQAQQEVKPPQTEQEKHLDKLQWAYRDAMTEYRHFENNFRIIAAKEGINLQDYLKSAIAKPIWLGVKKKMEEAHTELYAALEQQNIATE
jgi:hypothetical protein